MHVYIYIYIFVQQRPGHTVCYQKKVIVPKKGFQLFYFFGENIYIYNGKKEMKKKWKFYYVMDTYVMYFYDLPGKRGEKGGVRRGEQSRVLFICIILIVLPFPPPFS